MKNMIDFRWIGVVVFLSVLWGSIALGEVGVTFTPRVTADWLYDDNIYFTSKDVISDFVTRIGPGFNSNFSSNRWEMELDYDMQQVFYYHQSGRNSLNHFLDMRGWLSLSDNWELAVDENFIHSKDPVQISKSIGAISYEDLKYDYNEASVSLNRSFENDGHLEMGYRNMFFLNRSSMDADTVNHYPYMDFRYWLKPQYGVGVEGQVNVGQFDTSDDFTEPSGALSFFYRYDLDTTANVRGAVSSINFSGRTPDYDIYDFTAGITHAISQSTGVSAGAGYYFQTGLKGSGLDNYDGISYSFKFWRKTGRYSVTLEASKGYDEVYFDGENLGFASCYVLGGNFDYAVTDTVHLSLETSYRDDTFPFAGGWDYEIKERTLNLDLELYWHVNRWLDAGISLAHWDRDANDPYYEYLDNRAMFTLRLSKEFLW